MAEEDDDDQLSETLEKIAHHAAKKGIWSERSATDMVEQAKLHHASPRVFLRKLLEIKGGLTYDEIARLEKEALAPPAPPPPSKPLPKPFDGAAPPSAPAGEPATLTTPSRSLPRPFDGKRSSTEAPALPSESPATVTPAKALPKLRPSSSDKAALDAATPSGGTYIGKKLPKIGAKKEEPPAEGETKAPPA